MSNWSRLLRQHRAARQYHQWLRLRLRIHTYSTHSYFLDLSVFRNRSAGHRTIRCWSTTHTLTWVRVRSRFRIVLYTYSSIIIIAAAMLQIEYIFNQPHMCACNAITLSFVNNNKSFIIINYSCSVFVEMQITNHLKMMRWCDTTEYIHVRYFVCAKQKYISHNPIICVEHQFYFFCTTY